MVSSDQERLGSPTDTRTVYEKCPSGSLGLPIYGGCGGVVDFPLFSFSTLFFVVPGRKHMHFAFAEENVNT